jgi:galactose mutarotase-like enzyme
MIMSDSEPHLVDIGAGGLRAQINLHGAELWRLIDQDGVDLLWPGDPQVWSGRAPILFPIIGSLAGGVYRYWGAQYPLPRHGFARHADFAVVDHSAESALLRLAASDDSRRVYPFEFELDLRFTCSAGALAVAVSVANRGDVPMPFSFGFHPALRWPLEPGESRADHAISFFAPEPAPISKLDAQGLILPERQPSPVAGRQLALRDELFADDALIFTDLASRCVNYGAHEQGAQRGRHIRVDFDNLPLLGVWTKPGAGYICIEPWQGLADPEGFTGDIFAKPGIVALAPAASWHARMVLSPVAPR